MKCFAFIPNSLLISCASARELERRKKQIIAMDNDNISGRRKKNNKFESNHGRPKTCLTQISVSCKTEYLPPKNVCHSK